MKHKATIQDWARERIRSVGLRATPARLATLQVLHDSVSPMTHAEVAAALQHFEIDKATVFRNLTDLTSTNVLRRSTLGDNVWRFEIMKDSEKEHDAHPHFVCVDCGSVSCMEDVELSQKSKSKNPLYEQITEIVLRGHCNECAQPRHKREKVTIYSLAFDIGVDMCCVVSLILLQGLLPEIIIHCD